MIAPIVLLAVFSLLHIEAVHWNEFEVDKGEYKYYRFGVLGSNDAVFRLSPNVYPYGTNVVEMVLGANDNMKSLFRYQYRLSTGKFNNTDIVKVATPNFLSQFRPVMLKLKVWTNGKKEVFHEGHVHPFLSIADAQKVPVNYMAFTKFNKNLIFFYDCPM